MKLVNSLDAIKPLLQNCVNKGSAQAVKASSFEKRTIFYLATVTFLAAMCMFSVLIVMTEFRICLSELRKKPNRLKIFEANKLEQTKTFVFSELIFLQKSNELNLSGDPTLQTTDLVPNFVILVPTLRRLFNPKNGLIYFRAIFCSAFYN